MAEQEVSLPDDIKELLAMDVTADDSKTAAQTEFEVDDPNAGDEEVVEQETPEEDKAPEKETSKEDKAPEKEEVTTIDGIPILTQDGKHVIPYSVLKDLRTANRTLREQLDQAAAARQTKQPESSTGNEPVQEKEKEASSLPTEAEVAAKVEQLTEDYGEAVAQQYKEGITQQRRIETLTAKLEAIERENAAKQAASQKSQEQLVEEAIDTSPTMVAWQSDENSEWFNRSANVYRTLVQNDPKFAKLSYKEQFAVLPQRVKALFPEAPLVEETSVDADDEVAKKAASKVKQVVEDQVPTSLTDVAGKVPGNHKSALQQAKEMTTVDMQEKLLNMGSSDEIDAYLREIAG
jgi:uncharacterized coiled-coil protein SlyX